MAGFKAFWGGIVHGSPPPSDAANLRTDPNRLKRKPSASSSSFRRTQKGSKGTKKAKKSKSKPFSIFFERKSKLVPFEETGSVSVDEEDWVVIDEGGNGTNAARIRNGSGYYASSVRSRGSKGSGKLGSRKRKRGWMSSRRSNQAASSGSIRSHRNPHSPPTPATLQLRSGTPTFGRNRREINSSDALMKSVIGLWDENGVVRPDAFQSTEKTTREVKRKPVPKMDQDEEMAADGWQDVTEEDYRPPAGDASNPNGTSTPRPSTSRPPNSSDIVMTAFDGRTVPIEPTSTIRTSLAKSLPRRLKTTRRGTLSKGKTSKILNYDVVQNDDASGTVRLSQIAPKVKSNGRIGGSSLTISHFLSRLRKQEQSTDEPSPSNAEAISAKSSPVPAADPASIRKPLNESGRTDVPWDGRTPEVVDAQPPVPPKDDIPPAKVSQESRLHEPAKRDHPQEVIQQSSATEPPPMTISKFVEVLKGEMEHENLPNGHTQDPSVQFSDASSSPGDESDIPTPMREDPNPTTISTFLSLLKEETEGQLREQDPSNATNEGALPDPSLPQSNDPSISKFLQQLKRETEGENRPN